MSEIIRAIIEVGFGAWHARVTSRIAKRLDDIENREELRNG